MLLTEMFIKEQGEDAAIIFGRFNPPHQGHVAAWKEAAKFPIWYVGTNKSTQGPKDPLPYDIKIKVMEALYPEIKGHLVAEKTWFTLAAMVYAKHGAVTLHIVTDQQDSETYVAMLKKQNGVEGQHGFYNFKNIVWQPAPRLSSATDLRAAVAANDPTAFSKAAGVPADTKIDGEPFFNLVKFYLDAQAKPVKKVAEKVGAMGLNARDRGESHREPAWSFQEIAGKLNIPVSSLNLLAFKHTDNFPKPIQGISSRYGSSKYYPRSEVKRWVRENNILEKIKTKIYSENIAYEPVEFGINPNHPDAIKAKAATDVAYNENFADGKVEEGPKDYDDMKLDAKGKQDSIDYFYKVHAPSMGKPVKAGKLGSHDIVTVTKGPTTLMFLVDANDSAVFYVAFDKYQDGVAIGNVRSNGTVKATDVYAYLVKKYGKLYSDAHQTPSGRKIWDNLSKYTKLKVTDVGDRLVATENFANGKFRLLSKKSNKNLGTFDSKKAAEKHEREVQYFKHVNEMGGVGVVANNAKQAKDPRYVMSMTADVKPGETQRQAKKMGFKLDKKGMPPLAHGTAAKNTSHNKAYNLGLSESKSFKIKK
jgi:hypothetical protein